MGALPRGDLGVAVKRYKAHCLGLKARLENLYRHPGVYTLVGKRITDRPISLYILPGFKQWAL